MRTGPLRVFVNYRRSDTQYATARLRDVLAGVFGAANVFVDVDSISPGDDFPTVIESAVASCDVLLAMIGPHWSTAQDGRGRRRIDDPADLVRLEIELALRHGVRVVPVLVSAPMPDDLPPALTPVARRHAIELSAHAFTADAQRIVRAITAAVGRDGDLIVPGASVAGVRLGAPEESVEAVLGPAGRVVHNAGTREVEYTYFARGLQVYARDGVVGGFLLAGLEEEGFTVFSARTADGIGAGSSRDAVEAVHGAPDRVDRASGSDALDAARYLACGTTFCYLPSSGTARSATVAAIVVAAPEGHPRV